MAFIRERRRLADWNEVEKLLDDTRWLAFECVTDETGGGVFWNELIVSADEEAIVVLTYTRVTRTIRSPRGLVNRLRKFYPNIPTFELPVLPGSTAPSFHPENPSLRIYEGPRDAEPGDPA